MRLIVRRLLQWVLFAVSVQFGLAAVGLTMVLVLGGIGDAVAGLRAVVAVFAFGAAASGVWRKARRIGDMSATFELAGLKDIYVQHGLEKTRRSVQAGNRYATLTEAELIDVYRAIKPDQAPEAWQQLLAVVAVRVEEAYAPDGRLIPPAVRIATRTAAPPHSLCATHAQTPAHITCARCGGFACEPCIGFSGKHCAPCLELMMGPA